MSEPHVKTTFEAKPSSNTSTGLEQINSAAEEEARVKRVSWFLI
jgi:hypothetical protein